MNLPRPVRNPKTVQGHPYDVQDDLRDGKEENDVFVHISAVKASGITKLQEGQTVEYDIKEQQNGKMAAENLKTSE